MNPTLRLAIPITTLAIFLSLTASIQPDKPASDRPIAIIGEHLVTWSELGPLLAESSGGQILEELALSRILKEEITKRSITIGPALIAAERSLLAEMLAKAAHLPDNESETLIINIRKSRGLGDLRFQSLLERNAALRAMVRKGVGDTEITVTPDDIDTAYDLKYGPRLSVRLILVRSQTQAAAATAQLATGKPFAEVAAELSVDPSASGGRGGLLEPVSLSDPNYPVAVRRVLQSQQPGQNSDPISVTWGGTGNTASETGFAIVRIESKIDPAPNAPTKNAATKDLEHEIRTVREHAQMDKLAKKLLSTANISAMDPSLNWSWEQRSK